MSGYYDSKLSAERLRRVYEIAPPSVQQYLEAEIEFALRHISTEDHVVELGCGYGRILERVAGVTRCVAGIDTSLANLRLLREGWTTRPVPLIACMNAVATGFRSGTFDVVLCLQNGISAFHVDPQGLVREAARIARPGGVLLFSTYAESFWDERLQWFELQAAEELIGEIDYSQTRPGTIVCRDGFTATTFDPERFQTCTAGIAVDTRCEEVGDSSLFCVMVTRGETNPGNRQ